MKKIFSIVCMVVLIFSIAACSNTSTDGNNGKNYENENAQTKKQKIYENKNYVDYVDESDILRDVSKLAGVYDKYYDKYINYLSPNGKPIVIVAANKVTDEQVLKAYNLLSYYLTDTEAYNKVDIANLMSDNGEVLIMPNGSDDGSTPDEALMGQPLYQMEVPVSGSKWYQENGYEHRDASYEEIFHMVHDYGIGTTQKSGAMPELAKKIKAGMDLALPKDKKDWGKEGIWGLGSREWLLELEKEGSLEQEYIVSGIDSFFGLWGAYTESDKGMWSMYIPKTRADVKKIDKPAYDIITSFIGENLTYMERIAPEFEGTFKMYFDKNELYTFKSQYNQNVRLTGNKNSNIEANDLDNTLIGNKGNNIIDGKAGKDVVQFSGVSTEYNISKHGDDIVVKDSQIRDGEDTLKNIEVLRFTDKDIEVNDIK